MQATSRTDSLGRSLRHLIDVVAELESRSVTFRSLTEAIDTSTPGGKLTFHLFGALAELKGISSENAPWLASLLLGHGDARVAGQRSGHRPSLKWPSPCTELGNTMSPPSPGSSGFRGHRSTGLWLQGSRCFEHALSSIVTSADWPRVREP